MIVRYELPRDWIVYDRLVILDALMAAKAAMLALTQIPYQRSWADELQKVQLKREVAGTSRIEGAEFTDKDPYRVCRDLLDDTLTGHIPILMLFHLNERQARLEALEVGVGDIITKPFDIEELRLRVEAAIRLSTMWVGA